MSLDRCAQQPVIAADGFVLRPLRQADTGLISFYAGDQRVAAMTRSIPHPLPPGASDALVARANAPDRSEDIWALDGLGAGGAEVMGLISLDRVDRGRSEIGYWVAPAFWNTGVARRAVQALIEANPHGCEALFAQVFQDNPASARVLTNCGFQYLGDAETFSVARGANVPTWTYSRKLA